MAKRTLKVEYSPLLKEMLDCVGIEMESPPDPNRHGPALVTVAASKNPFPARKVAPGLGMNPKRSGLLSPGKRKG